MAHTFHLTLNETQLAAAQDLLAEYCRRYEFAALLHSQGYTQDVHAKGEHTYDVLAGVGMHEQYTPQQASSDEFEAFAKRNADAYLFGHLSYDFKNVIEPKLSSRHTDEIGFPLLNFVAPQLTVLLKGSTMRILFREEYRAAAEELQQEIEAGVEFKTTHTNSPIAFDVPSFDSYETAFNNIVAHLQRGDIYEINYCMPIRATVDTFDPIAIWKKLSASNPSPFSCLYRVNDSWLISASPERFIRKEGTRLFSQPMKGTARRLADPVADAQQKEALKANQKEISENIMIVDLVRNDLSRVVEKNSVVVEELCGIYTFPKVHQMISTIRGGFKSSPDGRFVPEIMNAMFPMGSMTGAPKIRAMEIIDETEHFARGLFSGSVGYIAPDGDFDFNVVIRSILYNAQKKQLLLPVGSAITITANARAEYEECLLKSESMRSILVGE